MTREEAIKTQAVDNADKRLKEIDKLDFAIVAIADYDNGLMQGFEDGAKWADKTTIDKICEWLRKNASIYAEEMYDYRVEQMIRDLKRHLEW